MNLTPNDIGGAIVFLLQIVLLFINLKVRADLALVRLEMYQHFVTKKDLQDYIRTGVVSHDRNKSGAI